MKEAAGEANLTVVAIILIAVVVAVATPLVRSMMKNSTYRSCCTDAGGVWKGSECKYPTSTTSEDQEAMSKAYTQCQTDAGVDTKKSMSGN